MEMWKNIIISNGNYEVSNKGRVRNKNTGKVLKPLVKKTGYCEVALAYNLNKSCLIHRLVAEAFIENPNNYKYINHKDENKANNSADNLEWCTAKYNTNYGKGSLARNSKVVQKDQNGNVIREWESQKDAAHHLNIKYQGISAVCRKKSKTAGGYIWEYVQ